MNEDDGYNLEPWKMFLDSVGGLTKLVIILTFVNAVIHSLWKYLALFLGYSFGIETLEAIIKLLEGV